MLLNKKELSKIYNYDEGAVDFAYDLGIIEGSLFTLVLGTLGIFAMDLGIKAYYKIKDRKDEDWYFRRYFISSFFAE